jgi:hypothetical protein
VGYQMSWATLPAIAGAKTWNGDINVGKCSQSLGPAALHGKFCGFGFCLNEVTKPAPFPYRPQGVNMPVGVAAAAQMPTQACLHSPRAMGAA